MRSRRFALLAGVLVALNLALWLAPQGLALRNAVVAKLLGQSLVRAEIVTHKGTTILDERYDQGVITSIDSTQVTVQEVDTKTQSIPLSSTTRIFGLGKVFAVSAVKPGWQVLVTWPANGSAASIKVEHRTASSGSPGGKPHSGSNG